MKQVCLPSSPLALDPSPPGGSRGHGSRLLRVAPVSNPNLNKACMSFQVRCDGFPGLPSFPNCQRGDPGRGHLYSTNLSCLSFLSLPRPEWRSAAAKNTSSPTTVLLKGFIFPCLKFQIPSPVFCLIVVFENRDLVSF